MLDRIERETKERKRERDVEVEEKIPMIFPFGHIESLGIMLHV